EHKILTYLLNPIAPGSVDLGRYPGALRRLQGDGDKRAFRLGLLYRRMLRLDVLPGIVELLMEPAVAGYWLDRQAIPAAAAAELAALEKNDCIGVGDVERLHVPHHLVVVQAVFELAL